MKALLFGSIGTLIETSELQRNAFNLAFQAHGLDWHWERTAYSDMLRDAGGADRVMRYADKRGQQVDAARIHQSKSRIFQTALRHGTLPLRPGVIDTMRYAKDTGMTLGFVTTTSRANVEAVLEATARSVPVDLFDIVMTRSDVNQPKPDPACYQQVIAKLELQPADIIAVEDNPDGVTAASTAGLRTIAFMGENTRDHRVPGATAVLTDRLEIDAALLPNYAA